MKPNFGSVLTKRSPVYKYAVVVVSLCTIYIFHLHGKLKDVKQSLAIVKNGSFDISIDNVTTLARKGSFGIYKNENKKSNGPIKVVLVGYLRGGTTFLGSVLGVREGTFYLYEPLYHLGVFQYLKKGEICSIKDNSCVLSVHFRKAIELVDNIFRCNFIPSVQKKLSLWQFRRGQGDTNMSAPMECEGKTHIECFEIQQKRCHDSSAIFLKIARSDMSLMEEILKMHANLKIVHLIRDPRAIMHSRHKAWYNEFKHTSQSAKSLCVKIKGDFDGSQRIDLKNTGHIYTLFYEDFTKYPLDYMKDLYIFVGYKFNEDDKTRLLSMTQAKKSAIDAKVARWDTKRRNSTLTAMKWRLTIPLGLFKLTTGMCSAICDMFGYAKFQDVEKLRDLKIPIRET